MSAGTGRNDLAVKNIDIPPKFVVLSAVAGIAQRDAEIKRICFVIFVVQSVYRLDGCVENMRSVYSIIPEYRDAPTGNVGCRR
jgi:hypothetical protein